MVTCTSRGARGTRACLAHVSVQKIGMGVICLTVLDILLPVHEPGGEELKSTLDDDDQLVDHVEAEQHEPLQAEPCL